MNLLTLLQGDLRNLSVEARKKYPAIKEAADRALAKLKALESTPKSPADAVEDVSRSEEVLRPVMMVLEAATQEPPARGVAAVVGGGGALGPAARLLSAAVPCLQKLLSNNAVAPAQLPSVVRHLAAVSEHARDAGGAAVDDLNVKVLQALTTLVSCNAALHGAPVAEALGISFRLHARGGPAVRRTASAALPMIVTMLFDRAEVELGLRAAPPSLNQQPQQPQALPPAPQPEPKADQHPPQDEQEPRADVEADQQQQKQTDPVAQQLQQQTPLPQQPQTSQPTKEPGDACRDAAAILQDICALTGGERAEFLPLASLAPTFGLELVELLISSHAPLFCREPAFGRILSERVCPLLIKSFQGVDEFAMGVRTLRVAGAFVARYAANFTADTEVLLMRLVRLLDPESAATWQHAAVLEMLRLDFAESKLLLLLFEHFDAQGGSDVVRDSVAAISRLLQALVLQIDWNAAPASSISVSDSLSNAPNRSRVMEHLSQAEPPNARPSYRAGLALGCLMAVATSTHDLTRVAIVSRTTTPVDAEADPKWVALGKLAESTWAPVLAGLSAVLAPLKEEAVLLPMFKAYEGTVYTLGTHGVSLGRDGFLATLCKFTEPVSHAASQAEFAQAPLKAVEAVKTVLSIAHCMGGILDSGWGVVLSAIEAVHRAIVSFGAPGIVTQQSEMGIAATALTSLFNSTRHLDTPSTRTMMFQLARISEQSLDREDYSAVDTAAGGPGNFCLEKLVETALLNVDRIDKLWEPLSTHIAVAARHRSPAIRSYVIASLTELALACLTGPSGTSKPEQPEGEATDDPTDQQQQQQQPQHSNRHIGCAQALASTHEELVAMQVQFVELLGTLSRSQFGDTRVRALEALYKIVHAAGQEFVAAWPHVIALLSAVGHQAVYNSQGSVISSTPVSDGGHRQASPPPLPPSAISADKQMTQIAFQTVHLICTDFLPLLPRPCDYTGEARGNSQRATEDCLSTYITLVGKFGRQAEHVNISLTSGEILWNVAYHVAKRVEQEGVGSAGLSGLWVQVFTELRDLAADERSDVRNGSLATLFKTLTTHGHLFDQATWDVSLWVILFPLLDAINACALTACERGQQQTLTGPTAAPPPPQVMHHYSRDNARKQWNQSIVMALEGAARLFKVNIDGVARLPRFADAWARLTSFVRQSQALGSSEVSECSVRSLHMLLGKAAEERLPRDLWAQGLSALEEVVSAVAHEANRASHVLAVAVTAAHDLLKTQPGFVIPEDVLRLVELVQPLALLSFEDYVDENGLTTLQSLVLRALDAAATSPTADDSVVTRVLHAYAAYVSDGAQRARETRPAPTDSERRVLSHVAVAVSSATASIKLFESRASAAVRDAAAPALLRALCDACASRRENPASPLWYAAFDAIAAFVPPALDDQRRGFDLSPCAALWSLAADCLATLLCAPVPKGDGASSPGSPTATRRAEMPLPVATRDDEGLEIALADAVVSALISASARAQSGPAVGQASAAAVAAKLVPVLMRAAGEASRDKHQLCEALYHLAFALCSSERVPATVVAATSSPVLEHAAEILRLFARNGSSVDAAIAAPSQAHGKIVVEVLCVLREALKLRTRLAAPEALAQRGQRAHLLLLWPLLCELTTASEQDVRSAVRDTLLAVGVEFLDLGAASVPLPPSTSSTSSAASSAASSSAPSPTPQ